MDDRPGDGTPFPQSQSWTTYGGKEYGLFACCRKFAAAQLAIACPDINNYFTTDSSFPYFITFFVRPESPPPPGGRVCVYTRSPFPSSHGYNINPLHACYSYATINIGSSFVLFAHRRTNLSLILTASLHAPQNKNEFTNYYIIRIHSPSRCVFLPSDIKLAIGWEIF